MVYTLDNLPSGARLAVIGNPVAHSLSPEMHNPALQAAGIDTEYIAGARGKWRCKDGAHPFPRCGFYRI